MDWFKRMQFSCNAAVGENASCMKSMAVLPLMCPFTCSRDRGGVTKKGLSCDWHELVVL